MAARRTGRAGSRFGDPVGGSAGYDRITRWLDRLAVEVTGATQRGSLPQYLGVILLVLVLAPGGALLLGRVWPKRIVLWDTPLQIVVGLVLVLAAVLAVRAQRRLTAVVLVGVTGYGTAMMFVLHGAPDLALTQFLVETITLVVFVLVLRRLPAKFSARLLRSSRWSRIVLGLAVGLVMSGLALAAAGGRQAVPVSADFPDLAVSYRQRAEHRQRHPGRHPGLGHHRRDRCAGGGGHRGGQPDFPASPRRPRPASPGPAPVRSPPLGRDLAAGRTDPARHRRSIIFEVVTRLLFHTMVLFSVYLLFSGHNAPGGGFAGGLVAGLALTVRYFAGGRYELDEAAPVDAGMLLGVGLFIAVGTGVTGPVLRRRRATERRDRPAVAGPRGPAPGHLVFFDIGVYLIVIGLVLDILRSLGAEMDRQIELDGPSGPTGLEPTALREEPV